MKVVVLEPHGFCAGVTAALRKAVAVASGARPVYCLHQLVHNEVVVADLRKRGFTFVESIEDVPEGATVLFSAHGVSPAVRARAAERGLTSRESEILRYIAKGYSNEEIADMVHLSLNTVKTHVKSILANLNVSDRAEAVAEGIHRGIIA